MFVTNKSTELVYSTRHDYGKLTAYLRCYYSELQKGFDLFSILTPLYIHIKMHKGS